MDYKAKYQAAHNLTQERYFELVERYDSSDDVYEEVAILEELMEQVSKLSHIKMMSLEHQSKTRQYPDLD